MLVNGAFVEYFKMTWTKEVTETLKTVAGKPNHMTTWEYLTIYLCLQLWGATWKTEGLNLVGDNLGSLSNAVSLRGKATLNKISKEISWRRVRFGWRYRVGHIPSERNGVADALSRMAAPGTHHKNFPEEALKGARERQAPLWWGLWKC